MQTTENLLEIARRLSSELQEPGGARFTVAAANGQHGVLLTERGAAYAGNGTQGVRVGEIRLLSALMDNTPDRIYFKDLQSRFILGNRALLRLFGLTRLEDLVGKTDFVFFSESHARAAFEDERRVMETGQPLVNKEECETWPDGTVTWSSSTKLPLRDAGGQTIGTFGISRDVTERRQAQEALRQSEERYRQLLEAVPTYTYSVQLQGDKPVGTHHSIGCVTVTGYTPLEYAADPSLWIEMVHPEDRASVLEHIRHVLAFEAVKPIEHRIIHRDGTVRWVRDTIVRHHDSDGHITRYDGLVEDITDRKRAELQLQLTLAALDARVQDRTQALGRTNDELRLEIAERRRAEEKLQDAVTRLKAVDQSRMEFVSNVSHELKTPLASIRFAVDNLLRGVAGDLPEVSRTYLSMIQRDADRLMRTILEILDVSRIESHTLVMSPSRVIVADFVQQTVEGLRIHAEAKQQELSVSIEAHHEVAEWDIEKMERALGNVIENAIKYTPRGGTVKIRLADAPEHPGIVAMHVVDSGVGIAPEHIGRVTERYYRAGENVSGAGLGLSIVKDILELHGGWVCLTSPPEGQACGTRASLYVPHATSGRNPA